MWGMESNPPAAELCRKDRCLLSWSFANVFIHQIEERKLLVILKRSTLPIDKGEERRWAGLVLKTVWQSVKEEGSAVGSRLENSCVNKKRRLLRVYGAWLFPLLENHRNSHLGINPKFQLMYRNLSSLFQSWSTAIPRLFSLTLQSLSF